MAWNAAQDFTVLVIHHKSDHWNSICTALRENGFGVTELDRGLPALGAMGVRPFDVVLLESKALICDAIAAARRVRLFAPATAILLVMDSRQQNHVVEALRAGADDCMPGDVQLRELIARICAVARRSCCH